MKLASSSSFTLAVVIAGSGIYSYVSTASLFLMLSALALAILLFVLGGLAWRGKIMAGYLSGALTFLIAVYFAHRLIATERFVPNGILFMMTFLLLFLNLLGVFLALKDTFEREGQK